MATSKEIKHDFEFANERMRWGDIWAGQLISILVRAAHIIPSLGLDDRHRR